MVLLTVRTGYSRAERISDAVVHISGVTAVLLAVPVLVMLAIFLDGNATTIAATVVYGVTLIAMIVFSALYNLFGTHRPRGILRRLDHSAVFTKIAGTYTPFTLLAGGHGLPLLVGLWGVAIAGIGIRLASPDRMRWLAILICLGMGWAGAVWGEVFLADLSGPVIALIVTGGVLYTVGVAFFLFDRLPFHYTIWHVFVLAASMVFYAAVTVHVVQAAP